MFFLVLILERTWCAARQRRILRLLRGARLRVLKWWASPPKPTNLIRFIPA
jgi:hypothetical protein